VNLRRVPLERDLTCPRCGLNCLHQDVVEIFNRDEDSELGFHITVDLNAVAMDQDLSGNPSPRRQGMRIVFACEQCDQDGGSCVPRPLSLCISQHKGSTDVWWEFQ